VGACLNLPIGVATNVLVLEDGGLPRTKNPASLGVGGTQYEKALPWVAAVWDTSDSGPPPSDMVPDELPWLRPCSAWLHPNWKLRTEVVRVMVSRSELYVPSVDDPSG
jgi:hypothetical protein